MSGLVPLELTVNGITVRVECGPAEMLSEVLRERLGLTGTKIGCNEAECGACTVLVDDLPVLSCTYPALRAKGRSVLTIEGLSEGETMHPLQTAFVEHGAVQCGFCIPGMVIAAEALLAGNPSPDEQEIRTGISGNLCRCTGYDLIVKAVSSAAREGRGLW